VFGRKEGAYARNRLVIKRGVAQNQWTGGVAQNQWTGGVAQNQRTEKNKVAADGPLQKEKNQNEEKAK